MGFWLDVLWFSQKDENVRQPGRQVTKKLKVSFINEAEIQKHQSQAMKRQGTEPD